MNPQKLLVWLSIAVCSAPLTMRAQEIGYRPLTQGAFVHAVVWQQDQDHDRGNRGDGPPPRRGRPMPPPPPRLMERLKNMPPDEREQVLENNRRFQELTPEQQNALRERLRQLQEMPPEQRELMEQRLAIFNNLTPRQQEKAREIYERRWSKLPPARRRALLQEFRKLRAMPPTDRDKYLSSKDAEGQFNPEEREVLKQLMSL